MNHTEIENHEINKNGNHQHEAIPMETGLVSTH
jgi:hypothetical protein